MRLKSMLRTSGWMLGCAILFVGLLTAPARAAEKAPVSKELIDALKEFKTADADRRQTLYNLIAEKGDARLIPAIKAYRDGLLQLGDDQLMIYGDRITQSDGTSVLPLIDAVTAQPVKGSDGTPIRLPKMDLSKAIKAPPRSERGALNELISALSLLDPDPVARLQSIRDAGERATQAIVEQDAQNRFASQLTTCQDVLKGIPDAAETVAAIDAGLSQKRTSLLSAIPDTAATAKINEGLAKILPAVTDPAARKVLVDTQNTARDFQDYLDSQQKTLDDLPKYSAPLHRQLKAEPKGPFSSALIEACAELDLVLGDRETQLATLPTLGSIGTSRAENLLRKFSQAAAANNDTDLAQAARSSLAKADRYQTEIHFVQNTFAGLSLGSILVLLALGLSIIFGLMGVINMAHGEFMMVGAFTTFVVSQWFTHHLPGAYDFYPIAAVPAAFLVSGFVGYLCEVLVIRHLYGRPLETLLATWGVSLVLIQFVRGRFGDTLTITPPKWMEGGVEVVPDLYFPLNRIYIIVYCMICIGVVYFIVNRTKLGLMLRATTQNRDMAAALGVATRRVDAATFAFGAGLAGLAGVAVPLYNKINPSIGQEYIVDSFMVVVVGGVGKLAGAIIAGLSLGFINKYLEPVFQMIPALASGASVIGKVVVLGLIVVFLQKRPAGLFPPKGRAADN